MICNQCPRKCNTDREITLGFAKVRSTFVFRAPHSILGGAVHQRRKRLRHGVFQRMQSALCFCQNYEISRENKGVEISDEKLVSIFEKLISQGAHNINLVNPSHYACRLASVLSKWKSPVPIVYNTSGYDSVETLKMLDGLVDIYLPDFKYTRSDKALRYSKAADYPETAKAALAEMYRQQPRCEFDEKGLMKKGVVIRHLILPSNTNSSLEAVDYLTDNFPNAFISLMAQYVPCGDLSAFKEIDRKITKREYNKVLTYAINKGCEKIFVQELDSADKSYIPAFDFTGVDD